MVGKLTTWAHGHGRIAAQWSGAALNASFSPASLGSKLKWWMDASDSSTITQSGGFVSEWRDKSGNGLHLSQGTGSAQPAFISNAYNGLSTIRFDGINDVLARVASAAVLKKAESSDFILVSKITNSGPGTYPQFLTLVPDDPVKGIRFGVSVDDANYQDFFFGNNQNPTVWAPCKVNLGGFPSSALHIYLMRYNGADPSVVTNFTFEYDKVAKTISAAAGMGLANPDLTVGADSDLGIFSAQDSCELFMARPSLTAAELTNVYTYLARWGV